MHMCLEKDKKIHIFHKQKSENFHMHLYSTPQKNDFKVKT